MLQMEEELDSLALDQLSAKFRGLCLDCSWFPGRTLPGEQRKHFLSVLDQINEQHRPLRYGFFGPTATAAERAQFLATSMWCVISRSGQPEGFAYNVDLGRVAGQRVIHLGLVKFNRRLGANVVALTYGLLFWGHLRNFGPFYATSVSHVPQIISLFDELISDTFPRLDDKSAVVPPAYPEVFSLLVNRYLVPVLGYEPDAVRADTFQIRGALVGDSHGFETRWAAIPKLRSALEQTRIPELLGVRYLDGEIRIENDLVQIGRLNENFFSKERLRGMLAETVLTISPRRPIQ